MTTADDVHTYLMTRATADELVSFENTIRQRRRMLTFWTPLFPGDRVITSGDLAPQYMLGKTGVVDKVYKTKASVKFDEPVSNPGRFQGATYLKVPMNCLTKVAS